MFYEVSHKWYQVEEKKLIPPNFFSLCRVTACQKSASSSERLAHQVGCLGPQWSPDLYNVSDTTLKLHLHCLPIQEL